MNKTLPLAVVLLAFLGTNLTACSDPEQPDPLTPQEQRLVDDLVDLYTLRILRFAQPDSAERRREEMLPHLDEATLQAEVDRLAADPSRAHLLLEAVHDSLEALRPRLFPSSQG